MRGRSIVILSLFTAIILMVAVYLVVNKNASSNTQLAVAEISDTLSLPDVTPLSLTPVAMSTATPSPTPKPTATPSPSPVPFSYYAPTTQMSFEELIGDNGNYNLPLGYPKADTYRIIVDKTFQVVLVYKKDENGDYTQPVRYMLCSTGLKTPVGEFSMKRYRVRFGYFQNDKTFGQYWSLINGRIYFHSILYTERNNASSYIEEPYALLGTPASHGCIRLTVPDARFIFYNIAYGTTVIIREGDPEDTSTAMIREQLMLAPLPDERVTLDPLTLPDTDNWKIETVNIEIPYEEGSQKGQE